MSSVLDKIRKMKERTPERGNFPTLKGIFHTWEDGENVVRLIGEFLEVRTHFIAPSRDKGSRGLCVAKAFQGDNHLPVTINCLDWDIDNEQALPEKTCPFCKLNAIARQALREKPNPEEKKFFDLLKQAAYARTALKWHLIDRKNPFVLKVENGVETQTKGYKIATIGADLWKDIDGVFTQCGFDITDPVEGIDLCITKTSGNKTTYSATAVLTGRPPSAQPTPLTEEELSWEMYDLKAICGRMTEIDLLLDAMHPDLRELIEGLADAAVSQQEQEAPPAAPARPTTSAARPAAPAQAAPARQPAPATTAARPAATAPATAARPAAPASTAARPATSAPAVRRTPVTAQEEDIPYGTGTGEDAGAGEDPIGGDDEGAKKN